MEQIEAHCRRCDTTKPVSEFPLRHGRVNKPCKTCKSEVNKAYYRSKRETGIDRVYAHSIMKRYGVTLEEYNAKLREQGSRCAICRRPESALIPRTGTPQRLAIDHDHATGQIRGLLCIICNRLVWALEDNQITLRGVVDYINKHRDVFKNASA